MLRLKRLKNTFLWKKKLKRASYERIVSIRGVAYYGYYIFYGHIDIFLTKDPRSGMAWEPSMVKGPRFHRYKGRYLSKKLAYYLGS